MLKNKRKLTHFAPQALVVFSFAILILLTLCLSACSATGLFGPGQENRSSDALDASNETSAGDSARDVTEDNLNPDPSNTDSLDEPTPVLELPYIGIYSGGGSWDLNVEIFKRFFDRHEIKWKEFDETTALSLNDLEAFDLIWFPGGFSAEYKYNIKDHQAIKAFVENGGMLAGTCAGAYYAADTMRWYGDEYTYPLGLFPGTSSGPLIGLVGWGEVTSLSLNEDLEFNLAYGPDTDVYYFDGPFFDFNPGDNPEITVLASYAVNEKPAVIAGRAGRGKYLLFGPHPELGAYSSAGYDSSLEGGEGSIWPWLFDALAWFINW